MQRTEPAQGAGVHRPHRGQSTGRKKDLQRDLAYLLRLWKVIVRRIKKHPGPVDIYEESDMIIRTIRDIFTATSMRSHRRAASLSNGPRSFHELVMPRHVNRVKLYEGREPLFPQVQLEEEIAKHSSSGKVPLKGGGSIVIDQTEALVAIDVNSGNFRADDNAEETAYQVNLSAAKEIARQIAAARSGRRDRQRLHRHAQRSHRRGSNARFASAMRRIGRAPRFSAPARSG
jgi:ribonuclease E